MTVENPSETDSAGSKDSAGPKGSRGVLSVLLPPDAKILSEIRTAAGDSSARLDDLANKISEDVAIALELTKVANSMMYSGGRPPVTTMKTIVERLGAQVTAETLDKMRQIPAIGTGELEHWYALSKRRCRLCSRVARFISELVSKQLAEECELAALFLHLGEVIAVAHFKNEFVALAKELPRSKLLYRLEKDHKFDPFKMAISYLLKVGIPEAVVFGIDPDAQSKSPSRGIMKPICMAASEVVVVYEAEKWEKYAPGNPIPPKSPLRMMGINDQQYVQLYERISEFFATVNPGGVNGSIAGGSIAGGSAKVAAK